jgi:hypothetical protein
MKVNENPMSEKLFMMKSLTFFSFDLMTITHMVFGLGIVTE